MKNVYAFFVAIDDYPLPHHRLNGCVNDMEAMKSFIEQRFDTKTANLNLRVLRNEEATREALVEGFTGHLAQAKEGDLAFYYFSGHGSQEPAHEAFWPWEETKMNQSTVCWDSRNEGGMDLADKEIGYLLSVVATGGADVVVVMDCCHSGSGTRSAGEETKTRQMEDHSGIRALESYLGYEQYKFENNILKEIPSGKHILLAAAASHETAKETRFEGKPRGVFTYSLINTLQGARTPLSYQSLRERTQTKVYNLAEAQTPQLEVLDTEDVHKLFLDGTISQATSYHILSWMNDHDSWVIQAGGLQGIPTPQAGDKRSTTFHIYPEGTKEADLNDKSLSLGEATVVEVSPTISDLSLPASLADDHEQTYIAVLSKLANAPMRLFIEGDANGVAQLRETLSGEKGPKSGYVEVTDDLGEANYRVISNNGEYKITRPHDGRPLVMKAKGFNTIKTANDLEHIARWTKTLETNNPNTYFTDFPLTIELFQVNPSTREETLVEYKDVASFEAKYVHGAWEPRQFKIKLTNNFTEPLYVGALYLSGRYGINHLPISVFTSEDLHGKKTRRFEYVRQIPEGESIYAMSGSPLTAKLGADYEASGITESVDILKIFASTDSFDLVKFEKQGNLELPVPNARSTRNQLDDFLEDALGGDWTTQDLMVRTMQPLTLRPLTQEQPLNLFTMKHQINGGMANLNTAKQASKGLGKSILPKTLPGGLEIEEVKFTDGWKSDEGLSVLEIYEVREAEDVSERSPLTLTFSPHIDSPDQIIAIGVDETGHKVVGVSTGNQLPITKLPNPSPTSNEGLPESRKIVFIRAISDKDKVVAAIG